MVSIEYQYLDLMIIYFQANLPENKVFIENGNFTISVFPNRFVT